MENSNNDIERLCKRCGEIVGIIKYDGMVLEMGNVELYFHTRLICKNCFKPFIFIPTPTPLNYLHETIEEKRVRRSILLSLNKKKKEKQNEYDDE